MSHDFIDAMIALEPFVTITADGQKSESYVTLQFMGDGASARAWILFKQLSHDVLQRRIQTNQTTSQVRDMSSLWLVETNDRKDKWLVAGADLNAFIDANPKAHIIGSIPVWTPERLATNDKRKNRNDEPA